jgi:hypothetical protein
MAADKKKTTTGGGERMHTEDSNFDMRTARELELEAALSKTDAKVTELLNENLRLRGFLAESYKLHRSVIRFTKAGAGTKGQLTQFIETRLRPLFGTDGLDALDRELANG